LAIYAAIAANWVKAFREMACTGDDKLMDEVPNLSSFDEAEWEWQ
jgi:hypothetical protein